MNPGIGKCIDIISSLADCILCHILSFLPTKYAVGTCILSKRWKDLWSYVPILDLDNTQTFGSSPAVEPEIIDGRFAIFVSRVLLRTHALFLQKFHLHITSNYALEHAHIWIAIVVVKCNVKDMKLSNTCEDYLSLPPVLFSSKTLEVLNLSRVKFEVPDLVWLPSLKTVVICSVQDGDGDSFQRFLAGCPVLEELHIRRKDFGEEQVLVVSVPTLKYLEIASCGEDLDSLEYEYPEHQYGEVVINAPELEHLDFSDYYLDNFCFKNLSSLAKACIHVGRTSLRPESSSDEGLLRHKLLTGISNVKALRARFFFHIDVNNNYKLPTFGNLTKLTLGSDDFSSWNLNMVADFLQCSPKLEVLILEGDRDCSWKAPKRVPKCLVSTLKKVRIKECTGEDHELRIIEYFMKNAKVLEKMEVGCSDANGHFRKSLAHLRRDSNICLHLLQ